MIKYILLPFIALGLMLSCSDSELITPGDEYMPQDNTEGTYSVLVDGSFRNFSNQTEAINNPTGSFINGNSQNFDIISISLPQSLNVGTYTHADGAMITLGLGSDIYTNMDDNGLLPFMLKITAVNNSEGKVSGSFSGKVYNMLTGELRELTEGVFIKIQFEGSTSSDRILKASFNGQEVDFSTNSKAEGIVTAAVISGENTLQNQTLMIEIPGGISIGNFTEEDEVIFRVNMNSSGNPSDFYSNYNPVTDTYLPVELIITSIGDGDGAKVTGAFEGTIAKFSSTGVPTDEITVSSGIIKVPIVIP